MSLNCQFDIKKLINHLLLNIIQIKITFFILILLKSPVHPILYLNLTSLKHFTATRIMTYSLIVISLSTLCQTVENMSSPHKKNLILLKFIFQFFISFAPYHDFFFQIKCNMNFKR